MSHFFLMLCRFRIVTIVIFILYILTLWSFINYRSTSLHRDKHKVFMFVVKLERLTKQKSLKCTASILHDNRILICSSIEQPYCRKINALVLHEKL